MALEIVWTKRATAGYDRIIANLERNWIEKEIRRFVIQTKTFLELLKQFPNLLEKSRAHQNVYRGPINKHTILTYRIKPRKKQIELINIRPARQKPLKN